MDFVASRLRLRNNKSHSRTWEWLCFACFEGIQGEGLFSLIAIQILWILIRSDIAAVRAREPHHPSLVSGKAVVSLAVRMSRIPGVNRRAAIQERHGLGGPTILVQRSKQGVNPSEIGVLQRTITFGSDKIIPQAVNLAIVTINVVVAINTFANYGDAAGAAVG
jgi:hypothetical protein